jgi:hypothetical protein
VVVGRISLFVAISPSRLDLLNQLMDTPQQQWQIGEAQELGKSWGIPLPNDVEVSDMSLLVEPTAYSSGSNDPRKAVLAIYSTDERAAEFNYTVFCLQVTRNKTVNESIAVDGVDRHPFFVMVQEVLNGKFRNGARSVGPVSCIFIAGSSFRFDLRKYQKISLKAFVGLDDFAVTLGVVRTPGGLEGVCLGTNGQAWTASVAMSEVSNYWLSDMIHSNTLLGSDGPPTAHFEWIVKLLNGELICWSVPAIMPRLNDQIDDWLVVAEIPGRPKEMPFPSPVGSQSKLTLKKRWLLGTCSPLGKASDWFQQASSDTQTVVSMGHVPESKFGCILQSGPSSLVFPVSQPDEIGVSYGTSDKQIFCQAPFLMTPPAFATSLHVNLLECASLRVEIENIESSDVSLEETPLSKHKMRLQVRCIGLEFYRQNTPISPHVYRRTRYFKITSSIGFCRHQTKMR